MDQQDVKTNDQGDSHSSPKSLRDKGDVFQSISEGLYLDVFATDQMTVGRPHGVIVFKL